MLYEKPNRILKVMRPIKKKNIGSDAPATKGDIEQLREDIHSDIATHVVSKEELNNKLETLVTKEEFNKKLETLVTKKEFNTKIATLVTKEEFNNKLEGMEDRVVDRVLNGLKARDEEREAELQAAHEDELDIVAGKQIASLPWKTVPRRLKVVENQVNNIKDHLHIS